MCELAALSLARSTRPCASYPERPLDRIHRFSTLIQAMDLRVGIEHRHAAGPQMRRRWRLSHADRASEPDDQHSAALDVGDDDARKLVGHLGAHAEPFSKPGTA